MIIPVRLMLHSMLVAWSLPFLPGMRLDAADTAVPKPSLAGVRYGAGRNQELDVWKVAGDRPAPAVIYFHGGSWTRGTRSSVKTAGLARYLQAGVAVVSVDYRFIQDAEAAGIKPPVQWPLLDAARAVQFVRSKAGDWGLDKSRIGFSGGSAGSCTALWLAMHPDLAQPNSADPVARESTRPQCAGVMIAQTTLDPRQIHEWFRRVPMYGAHAFGFHKNGGDEESLFKRMETAREELLPWIREYSPIEHASADDPPIFLAYDRKPPGDTIHGAMYGVKLKERLDAIGVACQITWPGSKAAQDADAVAFLISQLTASRR